MKLFFVGDSHTWPLMLGAQEYAAANPDAGISVSGRALGSQRFLCEPFFERRGDSVVFTNVEIQSQIPQLPASRFPTESTCYVLSVGFHTMHFMWIAKQFAQLDTARDERWAISTATWDAIIEAKQQYQMAMIKLMKQLGFRFVVVEAPRIFGHAKVCSDGNIETIRFVDTRVRETLSAFLDDNHVPFVRLNPEMISANGLMSGDYRNADPDDEHHAGPRLGLELMPQIIEKLRA